MDAVLQHVSMTIERRLSPGFVLAQLRQVGRGPLLRQVAVFADAFNADHRDAEEVYQAALGRQEIATEHATDEGGIFQALAEAWSNFVLWFGLIPERVDWVSLVPAWSFRRASDDDLPGLKSEEEGLFFGQ